jgi:hypothetical protein
MLTNTPLVDRFLLALFEPDLNSRCRGQFCKLPTMVLFVTPALERWAYDYFWLCVGAYSSDWSSAAAGTSARLILTHDPCIWHPKSKRFQQTARDTHQTHLESFGGSA